MRALVRAWYASLLLISLAGFTGAVWTHVESLRGVDPRSVFPDIWALQLLLNLLLIPLIVAFFRRGLGPQIREFPRWSQVLISALAVYYSCHFYFFMNIAADEIRADRTWRMFSAGWMALFAGPAAYYWTLLRRHPPDEAHA
jgi:hypothetical protein